MSNQNKGVWVGVEQLNNDPAYVEAVQQEFVPTSLAESLEEGKVLGAETNRRDFLKYLGFGLGAATVVAGCEIPLKKAIPFVTKPDEIVPGVANYYASSFVNGGDYQSILVKTREGRPIKIENNALSTVNPEGSHVRAQALVLSLYDTNRIQSAAKVNGGKLEKISWADLDKAVMGKISDSNAQIRIVSNTILSPTTKKVIAEFTAKYPNTKTVVYDAVSSSGLLQANEQCFGDRVVPSYSFDKAEVIVAFNCDFLGTWISPIEFSAQYAKGRKITDFKAPKMSRHIQVESYMSMTGSNADNRILVKPSEIGAAIATLYNEVAAATGVGGVSAPKVNDKAAAALKKTAAELVANKGKSLVVSGSNNTGEQILVNKINDMLGNYGSTIDFGNASLQRQGADASVQELVREMNAGGVSAIIVMGANPAFDLPNAEQFKSGLAKVGLKVSFAGMMDETSALCDYIAPNNHLLESWGDAQPKRGHYSLIQPTIRPLFDTRQQEISLLKWAGSANLKATEQPYYDYLVESWKAMFPIPKGSASFQGFWDGVVHDGVYQAAQTPKASKCGGDASAAASMITQPTGTEIEITFFETINMGAGQYANNPWLLEVPDPVSRTCWGNYLAVPIEWDGINDFKGLKALKDGDFAEVEVAGKKLKCTVIRQFGQMPGTVAIALGYGREVANAAGKGIGTNVQPCLSLDKNGNTQYFATDVKVSAKAGEDKEFACVQYHHTMGVTGPDKEDGNKKINVDEKALGYKGFQGSLTKRSVIFDTNLKELPAKIKELEEFRKEAAFLNNETLYPELTARYKTGHKWGMYVDLNACTGCSACTIACMSENNVPVVGRKQVHVHHEMTWLRIDRYFYGDVENPSTVYQPMMCQHCDNAPCENVCPVNATNHSAEGLNQMTYNRCIGTRYCANNCPYKVRRFNWNDFTTADLFGKNENYLNDAHMNDDRGLPMYADNLTRMVMNPDVTVRSRGVIEKCSFCVQRLQEGKLVAKKEGRRLLDSDVKTACQTACPTGAITFGDVNNKEGEVSKKIDSPLVYKVLEEINVRPVVSYTMKVNNRNEEFDV